MSIDHESGELSSSTQEDSEEEENKGKEFDLQDENAETGPPQTNALEPVGDLESSQPHHQTGTSPPSPPSMAAE
eukprot:CAMPEP_0174274500 /NCGR_PEP_ID=MMETSP0439-20130205/58173_1 /TAXON_ID=0 /ORGANISM="Stereomyxa ramosa, Strain Chinc5" /LENGTH=73 /DNA_ID=CAMNT_0015366293 /DNA_START=47 /DNA_END=268 /DNA_ORIENTATION=-